MAGALRFPPDVFMRMTLRELAVQYDGLMQFHWDQTSLLAAQAHNLMFVASSMVGKSRMRPLGPDSFHPFGRPPSRGLKITRDNIQVLRQVMGAMFSRN